MVNGGGNTYAPGDVVETAYGVGVIATIDDLFYRVMLWRLPGKSIGSSSVASVRPDAVSLLRLVGQASAYDHSLFHHHIELFCRFCESYRRLLE